MKKVGKGAREKLARQNELANRSQEVLDRLFLIQQGVPREEAIRIAAKWARNEKN